MEKAQRDEAAINFVLGLLSTTVKYDSKNNYSILGENGENLFYAMETSSLVQRMGVEFSLDVVYTAGGSAAPLWKLDGGNVFAQVTNAATGEIEAALGEVEEKWCFPVKSLSRFGCHGSHLDRVCDPITGTGVGCLACCCCQCWCEVLCCCFHSRAYLHLEPPEQAPPPQATMSKRSGLGNLDRTQSLRSSGIEDAFWLKTTEAPFAIVEEKACFLPWICTGCLGEGSDWVILKDAKKDESQSPLVAWQGQEIGKLRRSGRGLLATWCFPAHDSDHWKLDLGGTGDSKDKLAALATVLFMDFANYDQNNDA